MSPNILLVDNAGKSYTVPKQPYNFYEFNPTTPLQFPITITINSFNAKSITFTIPSLITGTPIDTGANFPDVSSGFGGSDPSCLQCAAPYINNAQNIIIQNDIPYPQQTGQWIPITSAGWMFYGNSLSTQYGEINVGCNVESPQSGVTSVFLSIKGPAAILTIWFANSTFTGPHVPLTPNPNPNQFTDYTIQVNGNPDVPVTFNNIQLQTNTAGSFTVSQYAFVFPPANTFTCSPWRQQPVTPSPSRAHVLQISLFVQLSVLLAVIIKQFNKNL